MSLIIHLDIEYVNFDYPAEPYLNPERSLELQRPVIRSLQEHLLRWGIAPLHLLSGRGHHLAWRISRNSQAFRRLAEQGVLLDTLQGIYQNPQPPYEEAAGQELGAAFAGVGQVLEYLMHQVLHDPSLRSSIPLQLTEVETSGGCLGREIVCVDLSEYGDPLHTRMVRIPFSVYHKPLQHRNRLGEQSVHQLPQLFVIPLFEMDESRGLLIMRDPGQVAKLARYASVQIPEQNEATARLVESYQGSDVTRFHNWYYSQTHEPASRWPESYDRTALNVLPDYTRHILTHPNDALLKPAVIRHLVRVLLSLGWHPRHIAGLIRSKYERDFGWGHRFYHYDAATRADFYTRMFAGLIMSGIDDLQDFCHADSLHGGGQLACGQNDSWAPYRQSLIERRRHERLASRPFHGLFFPDQHL
jgi:hypothetical protein